MTNRKIAIIYTGEPRTIEKTIQTFKENLLLNDNYHVFAVLQNSDDLDVKQLIETYMGNNLKGYQNFEKNDINWQLIQNNLLNIINQNQRWTEYLKNSGSMIEYYQMYLAYQMIVKKEYNENFKYDFVIRIRCDVVITHPIYFDWTDFDELYIKKIFEEIQIKNNYANLVSMDSLVIFMNSIFYKNRINVDIPIKNNSIISSDYLKNIVLLNNEKLFFAELSKYLKKGKFIITLRENVVFFLNRKYMSCIAPLGITYGLYKLKDHDMWFDSESQLKQICIESEIDMFDSYTTLEVQSLYEYNEKNYYINNALNDDALINDKLIKTNNVFFFIRRK